MFVLLTQVLVLLLLITISFRIWKLLAGKENSLVSRLFFLLTLTLLIVAFVAPDSSVGMAVFQLLAIFLRPLGLSILLLTIAAALITNGGIKSPAPNLILTALLILILSSTPVLAQWLALQVERVAVETVQNDLCCGERAGAIVLLGRGTTEPKLPNRTQIELTDKGDRIPYTAELYREGFAARVIVAAGDRHELVHPTNEAKDIRQLLIYMGVLPEDLILVTDAHTMREEALAVQQIMEQKGLGRAVILVTSALETRRAALTFTNVGLKVIPAPTNFFTFIPSGKRKRRVSFEDFAPNADALVLTTKVVDEYLVSFYYFLRGWLAPSL
ncbi:MAG: YdcF family protein [Limnospira sp.]